MPTTDPRGTSTSKRRNRILATVGTCLVATAGSTLAVITTTGHTAGAAQQGVTKPTAKTKHNPLGYLDRVGIAGHRVTVLGWTFDPDSRRTPINMAVHLDGATVLVARTSHARASVSRRYHRTIVKPGFLASFSSPYGRHKMCVYGYNVESGRTTRLACRTITVTDPHNPRGSVHLSVNRAARTITAAGAVFDPDVRSRSIHYAQSATGHASVTRFASAKSSAYDHRHAGVTGRHGFSRTLRFGYGAARTCVSAVNIRAGTASPVLGCVSVNFARPASKNQKIARMAKTFVGTVPYRSAGSSPHSGFDCSGLTRYVYAKQHISLAHSASAQYHRFKKISRRSARPGDLVFFLAGGRAYHVAVYEGGNKIVAAATYGEGVKYQSIWTSNVRFGTLLH